MVVQLTLGPLGKDNPSVVRRLVAKVSAGRNRPVRRKTACEDFLSRAEVSHHSFSEDEDPDVLTMWRQNSKLRPFGE